LRSYCISHRKDVDGLGAAAIVAAATGAHVYLSDYDDLIENLKRVPEGAGRVVVCDLGSDNADLSEFLDTMKKIADRAEVTYIDHHYMAASTRQKLRKAGVKVVHDVKECSSMLAYKTFRSEVPESARLIALCGAVTDYMDDSPMATKMMEVADRQFVLLEASMLSYALSARARDEGFPEMVVAELAKMKNPHEIKGVPTAAVAQLDEVARLGDEVKVHGTKLGRLAYMATSQFSTGNIAKLLIGAFDVPVGVAFKEKQEGWYEVSLRGTSECRVHLGKTVSSVAGSLGGSGGGHWKAAGCRIPASRLQALLSALSKKV
jgi:single-stranded DNA-specific DHH superfamily exonuclease